MRFSCNGCRVLRKGCSEDCSIKPCLDWIKSPEAQANATLFLAKFYGRAGLLNLINAGPDHLRPAIFRSLLHEACGRIVNPIYGSSGLISTGNWHLCQAAVEAVLTGSKITQAPIESTLDNTSSLFKACDIRHVSKEEKKCARDLHKVKRTRFKRSVAKPKTKVEPAELRSESSGRVGDDSVSHGHEDDAVSVETVEDTLVNGKQPSGLGCDDNVVGLELTLGLSLFPVVEAQKVEIVKEEEVVDVCDEDTWTRDLTLGLPVVC